MLFQQPVGALTSVDYHQLRRVKESGFSIVTLQLDHVEYSADELKEMFDIHKLHPIAIRLPFHLHIGIEPINIEDYKRLFHVLSEAFSGQESCNVILQIKTVSIGEIFDYFKTKPGDFKALQDFKELWATRFNQACHNIKEMTKETNLQLLVENVAIGGPNYFEPGQEKVYPLFRTPHELISCCEETGIKICYHTGNARIVCNVLQYMKRSRSMFAAATEDEILRCPVDWLDYYEQISDYVGLIHLSDSLSWGDTYQSNHIPFQEEHIPELLKFADMLDEVHPPVIIHVEEKKEHPFQPTVQHMLQTLKKLKRG